MRHIRMRETREGRKRGDREVRERGDRGGGEERGI